MKWTSVLEEQELVQKGSAIVRPNGKQIAIFLHQGEIFAIDNRCPHQGYPLKEGTLDGKSCLLTCQWHNWKFDLRTGKAEVGEDAVRTYTTRVVDGHIELDLTDPDPAAAEGKIHDGLFEGFGKRQYGRTAREIARLESSGLDGKKAVRMLLKQVHDRVEWGMTHAWAAAADWLTLYDESSNVEDRVITLAELFDHFAEDTLREQPYPYTDVVKPWDADAFLKAIEAEDENAAVALVNGAVENARTWEDLEETFVRAALMHYYDFGHCLIYVQKAGELLGHLGQDLMAYVLKPLVRQMVYATREDNLPDFRAYNPILADPQAKGRPGDQWTQLGVDAALKQTRTALSSETPEAVWQRLFAACAWNLLHFNLDIHFTPDVKVRDTASWLTLTHGLTFGDAVRDLCSRHPHLWYPALLQMACFLGRNKRFLLADQDVSRFKIEVPETLFPKAYDLILDHGAGLNIISCHKLKTTLAVRNALTHMDNAHHEVVLSALNRYLFEPYKEKHARRLARQALDLVGG